MNRYKAGALLSLAVIAVSVGNVIWTANQAQIPGSQVPSALDLVRTAALFVAALVAGWYLVQFLLDHSLAGLIAPEAAAERVRRVRASGPRLAKQTPNLQLGEQRYRGSGLSVSVYPGGIVIKPLFMRARAILGEEIDRVYSEPSLMGRDILVIQHDGADAPSPLQFYSSGWISQTGKLTSALSSLTEGWAASKAAGTPAGTQVGASAGISAPAGVTPLTGSEGFLRDHPTLSQAISCLFCLMLAPVVMVVVIPNNALFGSALTVMLLVVATYCARNVMRGLRGQLR